MRTILKLLLMAGIVWPVLSSAATEAVDNMSVQLELEAALRQHPIQLMLERTPYGWEKCWFSIARFNKGIHQAVVMTSDVQDGQMKFELVCKIASDAWIKGGWTRYRVSLTRNEQGKFMGTYEGTVFDEPVKGTASARTISSTPADVVNTSFQPIDLAEHPRLLFRKSDLPSLKERAQTPFGQAALAKMTGVIGLGLRYQLEGDAKYAEQAIPLVKALMADSNLGDKMVRGRVVGWRMEQIALAYDLCYDAWPESFRSEVELYFLTEAWLPFTSTGSFHQEIAWDIRALYPAAIRYGPSLGALAIWGRKGPPPVQPVPMRTDIPMINAAADYKPGHGVVVNKFESNIMPKHWLVAGGFSHADDPSLIASFGGGQKARPEVGTTATDGHHTDTFRALPLVEDKGHYGDRLDTARASNRQWYTDLLLYTVIHNDDDRTVQVIVENKLDEIYLAGQQVRDGELVRLGKGLYPFLIRTRVGKTNAWGAMFKKPCLVELSANQVDSFLAKYKRDYDCETAFYQFDLQRWNKSGGMDLRALDLFEISRQNMADYLRQSFGIGGFKVGEMGSLHGPGKYLSAFQNCFGRDVTAGFDVELFLSRQMFTALFDKPGQPLFQDIHSNNGFDGPEYGGNFNYTSNFFSTLFPLTPAQYKPAVLWGWHYCLGVTGDDTVTRVLDEGFGRMPNYPTESHPAWAFVNYPFHLKPVKPDNLMPLVWRTTGYESVGFRNTWTGSNMCLLQVAVDCGGRGAGSIRLAGFGQRWMDGNSGNRSTDSVVQLPGLQLNEDAGARITHYDTNPDGSGSVSLDLGPVYNTATTGVAGLRSVAVDYSGKSGATALIVVADKITGFDHPVWLSPFLDGRFGVGRFELAGEYRNKAPKGEDVSYAALAKRFEKELIAYIDEAKTTNAEWKKFQAERDRLLQGVTIENDTFTMSRGDATLRGRVFSNRAVQVKLDDMNEYAIGAKFAALYAVSSGLVARGGNEYLVVMTLSKGEPPKIEATGTGLGAVVKVGQRQVKFDGEKAVIQ